MKDRLYSIFSDVVLSRFQCLCIGAFVIVIGMVHPKRVIKEWSK